MSVVGIIAEYNPFHNGHQYQIEKAKALTGATYAVVVMSGNFVQRGTPAIADKHTRASMALQSGADLVLELPGYYATASAETFAFGSVSLLHQLSFVDFLSFGCETPNIQAMHELAQLILDEPQPVKETILQLKKQGISYPAARQKALLSYLKQQSLSQEDLADYESILTNPNNILALEYIKALIRLQSSITPVPVQRTGAHYHDTTLHHAFTSASGIRNNYIKTQTLSTIAPYVPPNALHCLELAEHHTFPVTMDDFSSALYYKLLQTDHLETYFDITSDFANKIKKNLTYDMSFSTFVEQLKSKDQVYTAICRNLLHILLDITEQDVCQPPAYTQLLGLKKAASHLLKTPAAIPVITKVANAKKLLSPASYALFKKELKMTDLYHRICYEKFHSKIKTPYQQNPVILP